MVRIIGMSHLHEVEITKTAFQIKTRNTFFLQVLAVHDDERRVCLQHIFTKMFSAGSESVVTRAR